jgi:hypothetical protein
VGSQVRPVMTKDRPCDILGQGIPSSHPEAGTSHAPLLSWHLGTLGTGLLKFSLPPIDWKGSCFLGGPQEHLRGKEIQVTASPWLKGAQ